MVAKSFKLNDDFNIDVIRQDCGLPFIGEIMSLVM